MKKLFLFDCDQTLWSSSEKDYISRVNSKLLVISPGVLMGVEDRNKFYLDSNVGKALRLISRSGNLSGIVSDNKKNVVIEALSLFGIYKFFEPKAINIKLWKGYCPKHNMVIEILKKIKISSENVYWFDDKDYGAEAATIGVNFIRVYPWVNLAKTVKVLLKGSKNKNPE